MLALPGVLVTFKVWMKSSIWIKHLRQGQSFWSQVSGQPFALQPSWATLKLSFFFPTLFLATTLPPLPLTQFAQYWKGAPSKQEEFVQLLLKTHTLKHLLLHYTAISNLFEYWFKNQEKTPLKLKERGQSNTTTNMTHLVNPCNLNWNRHTSMKINKKGKFSQTSLYTQLSCVFCIFILWRIGWKKCFPTTAFIGLDLTA